MNGLRKAAGARVPWALAFSFARAIQQPAMRIWRGERENRAAAQDALFHRARCNLAARRGEYSAALETM
jgi:fructose-bisphosphate aldolase class I